MRNGGGGGEKGGRICKTTEEVLRRNKTREARGTSPSPCTYLRIVIGEREVESIAADP